MLILAEVSVWQFLTLAPLPLKMLANLELISYESSSVQVKPCGSRSAQSVSTYAFRAQTYGSTLDALH